MTPDPEVEAVPRDPSQIGRCESCDRDDQWHLVEGRYALVPVENGKLALFGRLLMPPVLVMACKNRGHLRLYSADLRFE